MPPHSRSRVSRPIAHAGRLAVLAAIVWGDLLVVCDSGLRVAGVEILGSRDTRDHVSAIERDQEFLAPFV